MTDASILDRLAFLLPDMQRRAAALDQAATFPQEDVDALAGIGLLAAFLPRAAGGCGWGTEPAGAAGILQVLRLLGRGNLAVGRVLEAHVNAVRLVVRYGGPAVLDRLAADTRAGHLYGLWVTDPPGGGLALHPDGRLSGDKQFCSGAGHVNRAVVTAGDGQGARLVLAELDRNATATPLAGEMQGMRAATTGQVRFDGAIGTVFGEPGDYLREPDLSTGAWRTSAVTLGGLEALLASAATQLTARGRAGDPHQQARMGQAMIAEETARLWVTEAARRGEDADTDPRDAIAYVNLARIAVEQACLDAIVLVQRSLGVAAFLRPNLVERLCRDLATYLRQPAADMVLTEAAAHRMGA